MPFARLSGLVAEAGPRGLEGIRHYVTHLFDCFGPERLLWGSDWPVLLLASDYANWFDEANRLVAPHGDGAVADVFGGTAAHFHRLADTAE